MSDRDDEDRDRLRKVRTKAEAMAACDTLHQRLLQCYDAGGDWCRAESKDFWECYRAEKGEGGIRFDFARLFGTKE